jgi:hypothetical protein
MFCGFRRCVVFRINHLYSDSFADDCGRSRRIRTLAMRGPHGQAIEVAAEWILEFYERVTDLAHIGCQLELEAHIVSY